ncbi:MAG: DNA-processing protein DprA [Candidatus Nanopelagicaceae bacterium]|nr:DNA-processing protein DprA [Candidatus Nanopelagicaceae bacterium]
MNVLQARAILFASIEGGSSFWSREIDSLGPIGVVEKARAGGYDLVKFEKTLHKLNTSDPSQILEKIALCGGTFMTQEDPCWPQQLDDLMAPPIGLVAKGALEVLQLRSLAIVGTRNPTNYGVRVAGDFAAGFVDREWAIISGGAYGIDAAAHRGALVAEGITVAVLAAGIDINYPAGHMRLFEEITENGLIVSEVMPGTSAVPSRFLTRNRLIAALARATLVVEAAFRSGSLRTARDAAELLRPVMAIPGPITSPTSEGCHRLIGERAAEVVTSVADAMEFVSSSR